MRKSLGNGPQLSGPTWRPPASQARRARSLHTHTRSTRAVSPVGLVPGAPSAAAARVRACSAVSSTRCSHTLSGAAALGWEAA